MKKYIAILFACVSFCACEDFLTQENPNKIESEYYFKDESSLEIYANGLTRSFATGIKNFVNGDKNADTHAWDGAAAYFKDNYSASDASNWGTSNWSQLRSINYYLDNMRKADAPEAVLNHYEGVGRFFRALFYYAKVRTFGAVPWYEKSIEATDQEALFKDRDNREYVCRKILADLDYACTYCSTAASYRNQASYIHRYVALALKARFCLYEGTMRKYHTLDPSTGRPWQSDESAMYLGECVKACEAIMGDGVYHLTDNAADRLTVAAGLDIAGNGQVIDLSRLANFEEQPGSRALSADSKTADGMAVAAEGPAEAGDGGRSRSPPVKCRHPAQRFYPPTTYRACRHLPAPPDRPRF